jgi:SAM-dependent methyltransferase
LRDCISRELEALVLEVASSYPQAVRAEQEADVPRTAFHIALATFGRRPAELSLLDIGGGFSPFAPACAALGMDVVMVDDFADPANVRHGDGPLAVHARYGVRVVSRDVVASGLDNIGGPFDVVTCFDAMEHWHNSPKDLFRTVSSKLLKPGGRFVLAAPNCVHLRKRLTVPFGEGSWSRMADWYEQPVFRGHVREPDVSDLRYIARDMQLEDVHVFGRNWFFRLSRYAMIRAFGGILRYPMRLFPTLCSNIYMTGRKKSA